MYLKDLVELIVKREGKKREVPVGDVREIVGILSDVVFELDGADLDFLISNLHTNGRRRAKRKKRK